MDRKAQNNSGLIRQFYEAFGRQRIHDAFECFDPQIQWIAAENSPSGYKCSFHGVEEISEGVFARNSRDFESLKVNVDELFEAGEKVVMVGFYTGIRKATGKKFRAQVAHIWTFVAGKIVKFQEYTDTLQLAESGKPPSIRDAPLPLFSLLREPQ